MADPTPSPAPRGRAAIFLRIVASFWNGHSRLTAWVLSLALLCLVLVSVRLQALINTWNARFFDAVEKKAQAEISPLLWQFALYVIVAGLIMALTVVVRLYLMVHLRKWVTTAITTHWLDSGAYLRLDRNAAGAETPEFRIADDVRVALDQMVDLAVGFFTSVLLALTFFEVLARVGGSFRLDGYGVTIPAYFLIGALLYALLMSGLASSLGWPLIKRIAAKNHREGVFRYQLTRLRENTPDVAKSHAESIEHRRITGALADLVQSWSSVISAQAKVACIASGNSVLVGIVPIVLAVPKYVSGDMTLGAVMQLATAFIQVQMALNWMVDNFVRFAEWRASANRVGEFVASLDALDAEGQAGQSIGATVIDAAGAAPDAAATPAATI